MRANIDTTLTREFGADALTLRIAATLNTVFERLLWNNGQGGTCFSVGSVAATCLIHTGLYNSFGVDIGVWENVSRIVMVGSQAPDERECCTCAVRLAQDCLLTVFSVCCTMATATHHTHLCISLRGSWAGAGRGRGRSRTRPRSCPSSSSPGPDDVAHGVCAGGA